MKPLTPRPSLASSTAETAPYTELQRAFGDRIEVRQLLRVGGMARVYEAFDHVAARRCALKVLKPELNHGFNVVRFRREYRTALRLSHPCCVRVFEQGQVEQTAYFTMELLRGGSLQPTEKLHAVDAVKIALQVLSALDYIHARNIVHRDLKPENILISGDSLGRVVLADFGIAQVADLDEEKTVGGLIGTRRYMAPESIERGVVDLRADLYSLGVILYQLLAGEHPLQNAIASGSTWLEAITEQPARPLLEAASDNVDEPLSRIVMQLLSKDPNARQRTAAQTLHELERWSAHRNEPRLLWLPAPSGKPYIAATPIVARDEALSASRRFVHKTLTESSVETKPVLSVAGPAGCGKSRLLSALLKEAALLDAVVLTGECREHVAAPLWEVASMLRRLGAVASPAREPRTGGSEVTTLMGARGTHHGYGTSTGGLRRDEPDDGEAGAHRLTVAQRSVELLIELAARRPVLVAVEDLQWMGEASKQLLVAWIRAAAVMRRQGRNIRIAFVLTHRGELPETVRAPVDELHAKQDLTLQPLNASETASLVAALLGQPPDAMVESFARELFAHRECTPLFVKQMLQILLGRGVLHDGAQRWTGRWLLEPQRLRELNLPETLQQAIGDRAARLSVETQEVLSMAAVGGRRFAVGDLARALRKHEALLTDCLDEGERAGLISANAAQEGQYWFAHDRYREAIYAHLAPSARREHHRAWAETLLATRGEEPEVLPELAQHFAEAGAQGRAYLYAARAGDVALATSAFPQAVRMFELARQSAAAAGFEPDPALLERHGDACMNAGLYREGADSYNELLAVARDNARGEVLVKLAALKYRGAKERALDADAVMATIEDVITQLGLRLPQNRLERSLRILGNVASVCVHAVFPQLFTRSAGPDAPRLAALCRACSLGAEAAYFFAMKDGIDHYYLLKAGTLGFRIGTEPGAAHAHAMLSMGISSLGLHGLARRFMPRATELANACELAPEQAFIWLLLGLVSYADGDVERAQSQLERATELTERSVEPLRAGLAVGSFAILLSHRGNHEQGRAMCIRMIERGDVEGMTYLTYSGAIFYSLIRWYEGDYDEAEAWATRAAAMPDATADEYTQLAVAMFLNSARIERPSGSRADLERIMAAVDRWQDTGRESLLPSYVENSLSAAIAWAVRNRAADRAFVAWLERALRRERRPARIRRHHTGLYLGLLGALHALKGQKRRARARFVAARSFVRRIGVLADIAVIDRLEAVLERHHAL